METNIVPRPYQIEGIDFLTSRKRAMLTDAPSLGKTVQAALAADTPTLVVCPTYLTEQWEDWINEHITGTSVVRAFGTWRKKKKLIEEHADWTIINVEMLRTHEETLLSQVYRTIIFDESHHLKNRNAQQSKAAAAIADRKEVENVFLLTATPIRKEIDDLWMQLHILHPDLFTSYWDFVRTFCIVDQTRFGTQILGPRKATLEELEELLMHVRLGRNYNDVGREIPPVTYKTVKVDMPKRLREVYDRTRDYWLAELEENAAFTSAAQVLHSLRRITANRSKIQAVCDAVEDNPGTSVVFTWYRDVTDEIAQALRERGMDAVCITGQVPVSQRRELALSGKHVVATIASLSEGIDLSHATTVVFAEEHYAPGSMYQAMSRVRRERQGEDADNTTPVTVYYIHCPRTIDEVIHKVSEQREATIKDVIGNL